MKDGDSKDYSLNKNLTKHRLPVSNVLSDGTESDQFSLSADFLVELTNQIQRIRLIIIGYCLVQTCGYVRQV